MNDGRYPYPLYALVIGACGGVAYLLGSMVFPRLLLHPPAVVGEDLAGAPTCPPEKEPGSAGAYPAAAKDRGLTAGLTALGLAAAAASRGEAGEATSVEAGSAFQRLMLEDPSSAVELRNSLSREAGKDMEAIRGCTVGHDVPVSTFVEVAWTVRSSGDHFRATGGRFAGVRRGAQLPAKALDCLAAIPFADHAFTAPAVRLAPGFDSRVTVTFLLER